MNTHRLDLLLQYALAVASENDFMERDLGPIHLIKYVYLGDLEYASQHQGQTFTGINWQFYNFGPWAPEVLNRIEPALASIGAQRLDLHSDKYGDFTRWRCTDSECIKKLEKSIDFPIALAISAAVKKHGNDTESLLHYVYKTLPMVNAAPNEFLNFTHAIVEKKIISKKAPQEELTYKQKKKLKAKIDFMKKGLKERIAKKKATQKECSSQQPEPRYDDVFFDGVATLEKLAGDELKPTSMTCSFSDDFWKSKARYDPDIP